MNEQQNKNTVKNAINSLKDEAGIWHYIKTFLTFFALVGTAGVTLLTMFPASHYVAIFYIMSIVGFVSAIILSHEYIIAMCSALSNVFSKIFAVLGVVLVWVPYIGLILSFLSVIFGYVFGIILSIGICFAFPIGLTLFAYFIDRSKEIVNKKKEIAVALTGLVGAIALFIGLFCLQKATVAIETPIIKNQLDCATVYAEHIEKFPSKYGYELDIDNPTSIDYDEDTRTQTNVYHVSTNENNILFDYTVEVIYRHGDSGWKVVTVKDTREYVGCIFNTSGTYYGTGRFIGNLIGQNEYTFTFDELTEAGGSGSFRIYFADTIDETYKFTATITDTAFDGNDDVIVSIKLDLDNPMTYKDFVGDTNYISELILTYSMKNNVFETRSFSSNLLTLLHQQKASN